MITCLKPLFFSHIYLVMSLFYAVRSRSCVYFLICMLLSNFLMNMIAVNRIITSFSFSLFIKAKKLPIKSWYAVIFLRLTLRCDLLSEFTCFCRAFLPSTIFCIIGASIEIMIAIKWQNLCWNNSIPSRLRFIQVVPAYHQVRWLSFGSHHWSCSLVSYSCQLSQFRHGHRAHRICTSE